MTESELKRVLVANLPAVDQHDEIVEDAGPDHVRLRLPFRPEHLGTDVWKHTGGVVYSGPMMMGFADTAMYACCHCALGPDVVPVIATLTITFLRPAGAVDLLAEARLVRRGKRLAYLETYLYSDGTAEPIGHVTSTYALLSTG